MSGTRTGEAPDSSGTGHGPLAGVQVVDLSDTFMAPYASLVLAQMGAEVIKVELPKGDISRQIGDWSETGAGPVFLNVNRGKKSVTLDLRTPRDYESFVRLVERCDVFLHNRRPAAARRLRIDYPTLRQVNARLVHCAAVGFASEGPMADRPAYDDVIQAACGLASIQSEGDDHAYVRSAVADKVTGLLVFGSIVAALYERERSGVGQAIEVPMFESMVSFVLLEQQGGLVYDPPRGPAGYSRTSSPYRRPYRTADGLISVMIYTDAQWRSFFEVVGRPDMAADPRFSAMRQRTEHIDELYRFVEAELSERKTSEWLEVLLDHSIPAGPVNTVADLLRDEELAARLFQTDVHPSVGPVRTARLPVRFSRTVPQPVGRAPMLGEHNEEILAR